MHLGCGTRSYAFGAASTRDLCDPAASSTPEGSASNKKICEYQGWVSTESNPWIKLDFGIRTYIHGIRIRQKQRVRVKQIRIAALPNANGVEDQNPNWNMRVPLDDSDMEHTFYFNNDAYKFVPAWGVKIYADELYPVTGQASNTAGRGERSRSQLLLN